MTLPGAEYIAVASGSTAEYRLEMREKCKALLKKVPQSQE